MQDAEPAVRAKGEPPPSHPVPNERAFTYYSRLARLRAHLESNLSEPFTARDAARIAAVSACYFSTFFHDRVGLRFKSWVRIVRVERAKELIASSNASIAEIAARVGFNDLRTFERAFKSVTALTPREYKKRVRPRTRQI
jgi:AraC-like DNA-binding protein